MKNKAFSKSIDGSVSKSKADRKRKKLSKINIHLCEDPSMIEAFNVVTLLSEEQMVHWNSGAVSGIQLWTLLMVRRALLVAIAK